jgi:predicted AlkP superfamily phosphohydrolase/phosphomutase
MKKTLLIGLDAACWDYLDPLLATNRMPALKKLIETGVWGTMFSTLPAATPIAWASINTGKNPGKHGVFSHMWRVPGKYEYVPTNAEVRMGTPFWKRLNESGVRVGMVNVPFTHPPDPVDGFIVGGFGTPNSAADKTYPLEILDEIETRYGPYEPSLDTRGMRSEPPKEVFDKERDQQRKHIRIAADLARQNKVSVLVINLMLLDHANHKMPEMDLVEEAMIESDADLAFLLDEFQPDNVMVISDHGSRRVKGDFLLYKWLRDRGYYQQAKRSKAEQEEALNWILMRWLRDQKGYYGSTEKVIRSLVRELLPRMPQSVSDRIWQSIESDYLYAREYYQLNDQTDYSFSKVFPESPYSGLLYVNLVDRDPSGIIALKDKSELVDKLISELGEIEDLENGQKLLSNVYRSEDIYTGHAVEQAPDIVIDGYESDWGVRLSPLDSLIKTSVEGYFIKNSKQYGFHSKDGVFIFSGKDFRLGEVKDPYHIMDIPAVLLHLYGIPIPEDFDGHVRTDLIREEFMDQNPIRSQTGDPETAVTLDRSYTAEETEELVDRLKALGYLD